MEEFRRIQKTTRECLSQRWEEKLVGIGTAVKENITASSLKSLHPHIYDQDDFNDSNGK